MSVGTGLSFPIEVNQETGQLKIAGDAKGNPEIKLKQRLELIINIVIAEVFFNRGFGSNKNNLPFQPMNEETTIMVRDEFIESVNEQEKDATINDIQFFRHQDEISKLGVRVFYSSNAIDIQEPIDIEVE
jgi:phage baseplate assembly protein W